MALNISFKKEAYKQLKDVFPFKCSNSSIKYLGIELTRDPKDLNEKNFLPLLKMFEKDFETWNKVMFTWLGTIIVIKQNLLPKVLYKLMTILISIPKLFFNSLMKMIMCFIWAMKPARLKFEVLRKTKVKGGLGVPDLELYNIATHLS